MKIIAVDNRDNESINDKLICENINEFYGKQIVDFLNLSCVLWFYKLVSDDYKLYDSSVLYE